MPQNQATAHPAASGGKRRRIAVSGGPFKEVVAFQNPDGSEVLVVSNVTDKAVATTLEVDGSSLRLDVPAQSMNTVVIR